MAIPNRYRVVNFIPERILQARELLQLQDISQGLDVSGLGGLSGGTSTSAIGGQSSYRQGAILNADITTLGSIVSIHAVDVTKPISVYVRDRWENLISPGELYPVTLTIAGPTSLYLNWVITNVDAIGSGGSGTDTTLVDLGTGAPAAGMGQLSLSLSATDASGSPAFPQLYMNSQPIKICNFTYSSGTYTVVPIDNVQAVAYANENTSGFVSLTTNTSNGKALSSDDPTVTNTRTPSPLSVDDASVRVPISPGGTNSDGTTIYNLSSDAGGISATKIILTATTQLLSDAWTAFMGLYNALYDAFTNHHVGLVLGAGDTHPMPSAADVGGCPLSHEGTNLNDPAGGHLGGVSHNAIVIQYTSGYQLNRPLSGPVGAAMDPAYGVFDAGGATNIASLNHDGDIYSEKSNIIVSPGVTAPYTLTAPVGSSLALRSVSDQVLADHVNQTSHANPHGLTLVDIAAPICTQNTSSGHTFGVTYHNTGRYALFVCVTANCGSAGGAMTGYSGPTSPPTTPVASQARVPAASSDPDENVCMTFVVPAGYYYSAAVFALGLTYWVEWSFA
jgi:hypothetical protein